MAKKESGFGGVLDISERVWDYFARVSQMPWLDPWLAKSYPNWVSGLFPWFGKKMRRRCAKLIAARAAESDKEKHRDFLQDFIEIGGGSKSPNNLLVIA